MRNYAVMLEYSFNARRNDFVSCEVVLTLRIVISTNPGWYVT